MNENAIGGVIWNRLQCACYGDLPHSASQHAENEDPTCTRRAGRAAVSCLPSTLECIMAAAIASGCSRRALYSSG